MRSRFGRTTQRITGAFRVQLAASRDTPLESHPRNEPHALWAFSPCLQCVVPPANPAECDGSRLVDNDPGSPVEHAALYRASYLGPFVVEVRSLTNCLYASCCADGDGAGQTRAPRRRAQPDACRGEAWRYPDGACPSVHVPPWRSNALCWLIDVLASLIWQIPTLASCSFDEIMDAAQPDQVQFLQL